MSGTRKGRVAGQKIVDMQVIDTSGKFAGSVKDVGVDLENKQLILYVVTKENTEIEIPAAEIVSIEDVVLITGQDKPRMPPLSPSRPPSVTAIACPKCKTTLPAHAKFCAKCGSKITSQSE